MITICIHCENFVSTPDKPFPPISCSQACHGYRNGCTCPGCEARSIEAEKQHGAEEKQGAI